MREGKVKVSVWKQKERWKTKENSRISHSSTYGRVVSQSHCCATPQEYEWAKSSPHFIIFFRLCVSEIKQGEERRRRKRRKIKVAPRFLVYVSLDWKYLFLSCERNFHISRNYLHVISHAIIEKFYMLLLKIYVLSNSPCFILNFYFSCKWEFLHLSVRNNIFYTSKDSRSGF